MNPLLIHAAPSRLIQFVPMYSRRTTSRTQRLSKYRHRERLTTGIAETMRKHRATEQTADLCFAWFALLGGFSRAFGGLRRRLRRPSIAQT